MNQATETREEWLARMRQRHPAVCGCGHRWENHGPWRGNWRAKRRDPLCWKIFELKCAEPWCTCTQYQAVATP